MATKRKRVAFAVPEDDEIERKDVAPAEKRTRTFKEKNSLDSDEEDKADDEGELGDEDLAHQEQTTVGWDEGQKITPFNLDEEMEEGRFDAHGNYYAKEEDVADSWLDSVNWDKVRAEEDSGDEQSASRPAAGNVADDGDDSDSGESDGEAARGGQSEDEVYCLLQKAVGLVKPGETVASAVRRLGTTPGRPKFRKGKAPVAPSDGLTAEQRAEKRAAFSALTDVADRLVQLGRMSVYEETYEKFSFEIREYDGKFLARARQETAKADSQVVSASGQGSSKSTIPEVISGAAKADSSCTEVCWHVKWNNDSSAQLLGPFSSTQMNEWSEQGLLGSAGAFVRKAKDSESDFYSSKRIDFDLYTD